MTSLLKENFWDRGYHILKLKFFPFFLSERISHFKTYLKLIEFCNEHQTTTSNVNDANALGKYPYSGEEDPDCINSGKQSATLVAGAAMFDSSEAFAMIRGGHLNMKMLGAMEINKYGDLADWIIPGQWKNVKGMGGGMDLVANDSYCVVLTHHCTSKGEPKIVEHCSYPITGENCVNKIITLYLMWIK